MANLRSFVCTLGLAALLCAGCGRSKPTRFFILTSSPAPASHRQRSAEQLVVGVGPVNLPQYLDRPQIVSRTSGSRLKLAEFDRWAEPLAQSFARALTENLSGLLATERVVLLPWRGHGPADFRIPLEIIRFDGTPGGEVSLIARWTLLGKDGTELAAPRRSEIAVSTQKQGYEGVASAMSDAVSKLSREIVSAIRAHR